MEYKVIIAYDGDTLVKRVELNMKLGWEPIGGIAMTQSRVVMGTEVTWAQAMIRK